MSLSSLPPLMGSRVRRYEYHGTNLLETTKPHDPSAKRDASHCAITPHTPTPFDPFKDFTVSSGRAIEPLTNGREFGQFVSPDRHPTDNLVDPRYASEAERSRK